MPPPLRASQIVAMLDLKPHPEGGFYSETFRDSSIALSRSQLPPRYKVDRPISTSIYFLMPSGNVSLLHRIPCAETWHFYSGEPFSVFEIRENGEFKVTVLGTDLESGQIPQYTVPPDTWFGSFPTMDVESDDLGSFLIAPKRDPEIHYSLVGCTCAPAFQFEDFEMASYWGIVSLAPKAGPFIRYLTPKE